jgi:hypothetical protein
MKLSDRVDAGIVEIAAKVSAQSHGESRDTVHRAFAHSHEKNCFAVQGSADEGGTMSVSSTKGNVATGDVHTRGMSVGAERGVIASSGVIERRAFRWLLSLAASHQVVLFRIVKREEFFG